MGRNPTIVSVYTPWKKPWVRNAEAQRDRRLLWGRPLVSWHCGDSNERIASGADDDLIVQFADQLKSYGRPVLLRWYWEANLPVYPHCLGTGPVADQAKQYVDAFRRIAGIFDREGASNVEFVWSISASALAFPMEMFYPGDDYVDWIGADGYDREQQGREAFTEVFSRWYRLFEGRGKPLIVTETGATTDQARVPARHRRRPSDGRSPDQGARLFRRGRRHRLASELIRWRRP